MALSAGSSSVATDPAGPTAGLAAAGTTSLLRHWSQAALLAAPPVERGHDLSIGVPRLCRVAHTHVRTQNRDTAACRQQRLAVSRHTCAGGCCSQCPPGPASSLKITHCSRMALCSTNRLSRTATLNWRPSAWWLGDALTKSAASCCAFCSRWLCAQLPAAACVLHGMSRVAAVTTHLVVQQLLQVLVLLLQCCNLLGKISHRALRPAATLSTATASPVLLCCCSGCLGACISPRCCCCRSCCGNLGGIICCVAVCCVTAHTARVTAASACAATDRVLGSYCIS